MLTILVVVAVFSILVLVHELGHMFAAKKLGVKVEKFSLGFGKKLFGIKRGETEYVVSVCPFGGYVKLAGDNPAECQGTAEEFYSKSFFARFLIITAGPLTNYFFAFILFIVIFIMGVPSFTAKVDRLLPGYPAVTSGLREGDSIFEVGGKGIEYWDDLVAIVQKSTTGAPLEFKVTRGEEILTFKIPPKVVKTKNIFGQETMIGMIGISPRKEIVLVRHGLLEAIALGGKRTVMLTTLTYKGLWLLITGGMPLKESVAGPIGIAFLIGQAAKLGFIYLLSIMAHINVALAVFNLLPIPILDGGHILFLAIERLRGRPVSPRAQEMVGQIALYILIAFALFISWNDITRFFPFMRR
ncbi:MAG: RIP metalloprotease RseP [Omnitrophica bacterium RBG_13_46_9]|nr:MAG: RIP metalloprotease RseP [Omnitrophica bacterium RBG_13_46_9]